MPTHTIQQSKQPAECMRFAIEEKGKEIARAYLYFISNHLHDAPYALLEDVFVDEEYRGKGVGSQLVEHMIIVAKEKGCYKIIGTARSEREVVHAWYQKLGFRKYGFEFRMDLEA